MKDPKDPILEAAEAEVLEQLKEIKKARIYQGSNPSYRQDADRALKFFGGYTRLRATVANEKTNELIERRLEQQALSGEKDRLGLGSGSQGD